jgi:hypothetical protein
MIYFNNLGYKTANPAHNQYIIKGFQDHTGLLVDGVIGPITRAKMKEVNHKNYCPEVFEPIKPYREVEDRKVESVLIHDLKGLGRDFNYYAEKNDIDVFHVIAHAALESGWGGSKIAKDKNNLFGWNAVDSSAYDSAYGFSSYKDCIKEWCKWWNEVYLIPSGGQYRGNSEYAVNVVYASSSVAGINKSFIVQRLRKSLEKPNPYLPESIVPGAKDFVFREGYSNIEVNGVRKYKVDPIPLDLIENAIRVFQNLQLIRNFFGVPVIISFLGNLYRNPTYNAQAGGSTTSYHMKALAADVRVVGVSSHNVYRWAKDNTDFMGFGIINNTWIHLDLRDTYWYKEY